MKACIYTSIAAVAALSAGLAQAGELDRTVLPIAPPVYPQSTVLDVRDATPPPRFEISAPEGAPNVIVCLLYTSPSPRDS